MRRSIDLQTQDVSIQSTKKGRCSGEDHSSLLIVIFKYCLRQRFMFQTSLKLQIFQDVSRKFREIFDDRLCPNFDLEGRIAEFKKVLGRKVLSTHLFKDFM